MSVFRNITRGGQTAINNITMFNAVFKYSFSLALLMSFIVYLIYIIKISTWLNWLQAYDYFIAKLTYTLNSEDSYRILSDIHTEHGVIKRSLRSVVLNMALYRNFQFIFNLLSIKLATALALGSIPFTLLFMISWYAYHKQLFAPKIMHGRKLVLIDKFNKMIKEYNHKQKDFENKKVIEIGKAILPFKSELMHTMITGSSGSGKTVALRTLINQIRLRGDRAIIIDSDSLMMQSFYRPDKDLILNPMDERTLNWSPWSEGHQDEIYRNIALSLIPDVKGGQDPFWNISARIGLVEALRKQYMAGLTTVSNLKKIFSQDFENICEYFKNTEAASIISKSTEKTGASIVAILSSYLNSLNLLKDSEKPFSVSDWCKEGKPDQCLFISTQLEFITQVRPLMSIWLDFAMKALMRPEFADNPNIPVTWIIIDELSSLQKLPFLIKAITEGRKYRIAVVIAFQDINQIHEIYGANFPETLSNNCSTKLFFGNKSSKTNIWAAENIGKVRQKEFNENISFGNSPNRDGFSFNNNLYERFIVQPEQIDLLQPGEAFLKTLHFPITKIRTQI